jgi:hypothetical protein
MTVRRLASAFLLLAAGCGAGVHATTDPRSVLSGLSKTDAERLSKKRVFFGHQSVGYNIVDGLAALETERPDIGFAIKETRDPAQIGAGVFAHTRIGQNEAPASKIRDFATTLDGGMAEHVDVAFFKFCYVDFNATTDAAQVFSEYKTAMSQLRQKYPKLTMVHVTVPLAVVEGGPKAFIKRIIGKKPGNVPQNLVRNRYNELLRHEYAGKEPLFDLAAIESTRLDGANATFEDSGTAYPMLAAEYASDGKHLNALGGRWVAAHLVKFLAGLAD